MRMLNLWLCKSGERGKCYDSNGGASVLQCVVVGMHSCSVCSVCLSVCVQDERGAREQSPSMDIDVQEEEAEGESCVSTVLMLV